VGGQKSIHLGSPARSLPKTTQSERDTTRHHPTLPSGRTSPELDGLLPPYNVRPWYGAREPVYLTVLGMDSAGHPLLEVTTPQSSKPRVILVPAPDTALAVNGAGAVPPQPSFGSSVSDEHGTWLAAADGGIWLYDPKAGFRRVAQLPLPPRPSPVSDIGMPGITPVVAGPCL
jgi:hypothetical protein